MNGNLCRNCGRDHETSLEALRCAERCADSCGCGHCRNCVAAKQWREHPRFEAPSEQPNAGHEPRALARRLHAFVSCFF